MDIYGFGSVAHGKISTEFVKKNMTNYAKSVFWLLNIMILVLE